MAAADVVDAEHLEEVESGAEAGGNVGDEKAGAATDRAAYAGEAVDAGLADKEREDGSQCWGPTAREHFRAHAADPPEVGGEESAGGEKEVGGRAEI